MVTTAVHARARCTHTRTSVVTRTRKVAVLLGTHQSALRVSSSRSSRDRSPMVAATSMRAPTATPTSRGALGASLRRGASARASRVGASSARRPVAARAAAFAPRRAPARVREALAPVRPTRAAHLARRSRLCAARAAATPNGPNACSADAVNNGLACFEARQYEDAVVNFTSALNDFGAPSEDESRAALYNRACASCKLRRFDSAKADLTSAVNEYGLKFSVVLKDSDMEVFRGTPQYEEMADEVKGFRSGASIAKLKAEAVSYTHLTLPTILRV